MSSDLQSRKTSFWSVVCFLKQWHISYSSACALFLNWISSFDVKSFPSRSALTALFLWCFIPTKHAVLQSVLANFTQTIGSVVTSRLLLRLRAYVDKRENITKNPRLGGETSNESDFTTMDFDEPAQRSDFEDVEKATKCEDPSYFEAKSKLSQPAGHHAAPLVFDEPWDLTSFTKSLVVPVTTDVELSETARDVQIATVLQGMSFDNTPSVEQTRENLPR